MGDPCYPFHQLMVQSLELINKNLERSWKDMMKRLGYPLFKFDYSRGNSSISKSYIRTPWIRITAGKIFFVVKFGRGFAKAPSFLPESDFNLDGWELAFRCETGGMILL